MKKLLARKLVCVRKLCAKENLTVWKAAYKELMTKFPLETIYFRGSKSSNMKGGKNVYLDLNDILQNLQNCLKRVTTEHREIRSMLRQPKRFWEKLKETCSDDSATWNRSH